MSSQDVSTPVVVLGCSRHGGLGITRTLGRMGVAVYHVDRNRHAPSFYSRYSRGRLIWDLKHAPAADSLAIVEKLAAAIGRSSILIPTSDAMAMWVADHGAALRRWFQFPDVRPDLVRSLCSKRELFRLARDHGIPTAETACPQSPHELEAYAKSTRYPVLAKPVFGSVPGQSAKPRIFRIHNRGELLGLYNRPTDWAIPQYVLQEFIPGAADACWIFNGYFDAGNHCLLEFTGRKLRQYPVDGGLTSLGECRRNDTIVQLTRRLMKACGYRGIVDVDYRYDARDGQFKVLDVNPRVGATFRLFSGVDGMDVVRALYLDLTGQGITSSPAPDGRRWLVEDCDLAAGLRGMRAGKLSAGEWLRSLRGVQELAILAADDPLPAFWMAMRHLPRLWPESGHLRDADVNYQASRLAMLTRKRGLARSDSSIS